MEALLQLCHGSILASNAATQLLEYALFLGFPVTLAALLQETVELLLCLLSSLLDRRYEVLFMSMTQVACHICVLEWLQGRESGGCVEVRY